MENCANCEKPIGNLERSFEWKGSNVCRTCFDELRRPDSSPAAAPPPAGDDEMLCPNPNCGCRVTPFCRDKGNPVILIALLLLGIIPGVIYAVICMGKAWYCPQCKGLLQPPPEVVRSVLRRERMALGRA